MRVPHVLTGPKSYLGPVIIWPKTGTIYVMGKIPKNPAKSMKVAGIVVCLFALLPVAIGLFASPESFKSGSNIGALVGGAIFFIAGTFVFFHSKKLSTVMKERETKLNMYRREEWRADWDWKEAALADEHLPFKRGLRSQVRGNVAFFIIIAALTFGFSLPFLFSIAGSSYKDTSAAHMFPSVYTGLFFLLCVIVVDVYLINAWIKHQMTLWSQKEFGRGKITLASMPCYIGESFTVRFLLERPVPEMNLVKATLRCVRFVLIQSGGKDGPNAVPTLEKEYNKEISISSSNDLRFGVDIEMTAPDGPPTELIPFHQTAVYWELEIRVPRPGVDYVGRFMIPMYKRQIDSGDSSAVS